MIIFKKQKGFTLVELLVVLAIVGILLALAVGGIRIVQEVNRDTQRKALVRDVQLALESYQEKHNGYPTTQGISLTRDSTKGVVVICACCSGGTCSCNSTCSGGEKVESKAAFDTSPAGTASTSCGSFPTTGPETTSGRFYYCYQGTAKAYILNILLERSSDVYKAGNE
jgi:prepilin-type N-terminal cleavage/methylation domain-containing protein